MLVMGYGMVYGADEWWKPYSPPCTERENVFEFTEKPKVRKVAEDRYEITFAVKGYCDVTVAIIDPDPKKELVPGRGVVVRHLGAGVLGPNAPLPFQKNSLKQTLYWDGKDDLGWYMKEPEKLKVRVSLGLKPEFDKLLADYGPHNLPGLVFGIAISEEGAFVFAKAPATHTHAIIRKYGHNGEYLGQLTPPPASMPEEKLAGLSYVEYEPGKRAVHGVDISQMATDCFYLPAINSKLMMSFQPVVVGRKLYFPNSGCAVIERGESLLHYIYTDGSTDVQGIKGIPFVKNGAHLYPRMAVSPDGKRLYVSALGGGGMVDGTQTRPLVVVKDFENIMEYARIFVGKMSTERGREDAVPGSDNESLNNPFGIDCDAQGRVYIADNLNGRIQVFSPEGKWLKTIPVDRPRLIRVHRKSGAFYVTHSARVEGRTVGRLTKFKSFDEPVKVWHIEYPEQEPTPAVLAVDEWTPKPRLWTAGGTVSIAPGGIWGSGPSVRIYEDDGDVPRKIVDFDEIAHKQAGGERWLGRWFGGNVGGSGGAGKLVCDPTRETAYYGNRHIFDLRTGAYLGELYLPGTIDDIAFDKRGYLHAHFNPGFYMQGAGRLDPGRATKRDAKTLVYPEIPYDYGEERKPWMGILPLRDQPGAKFFQDGIGVNMQGDIAVNSNIYYVPKTEDDGFADLMSEWRSKGVSANIGSGGGGKYDAFVALLRNIKEKQKQGEEIYFIKRQPGIPLCASTIWTFDRDGKLRAECAAIISKHIAGVQIDEDGNLYFVASLPRMYGDRHFLCGKGGTFGVKDDKANANPFTGTLLKCKGSGVKFLLRNAPVPLETLPNRNPDLINISFPNVFGPELWTWVENVEWFYAGASPVVHTGCTCPTLRHHTDWYKRSFVPEAYRHSVGILDTAGNLIMHLGKYGNYDSGHGPKSRIPVGGDNIAFFVPRFISGTDNYLTIADWDERLVVLRLNYHVEEIQSIQ
jgi:hypothetical protein